MKLPKIARALILMIGVSLLVFIAAGAIYYRSPSFFPFALGAVLGAALNVLKVIMLERAVEKAVNMESKGAGNYIRIQYLLRFLLTGIVLALAAVVPFISLWGAIAGVFTLQIATLCLKPFLDRYEDENDGNGDGNA